MRRLAAACLVFAASLALACASSAPHTVPAAAINTGLGLGAAAAQRSAGGCYAVCTNGTVCNPRSGLCEAASSATSTSVCQEAPGGGMRCVPFEIGREQAQRPGASAPVGISPATGVVLPPPGESSPRGP